MRSTSAVSYAGGEGEEDGKDMHPVAPALFGTSSSMISVMQKVQRKERLEKFAHERVKYTKSQLAYKKRVLGESSSFVDQYHHVYDRFKRSHVMCTAAVLIFAYRLVVPA